MGCAEGDKRERYAAERREESSTPGAAVPRSCSRPKNSLEHEYPGLRIKDLHPWSFWVLACGQRGDGKIVAGVSSPAGANRRASLTPCFLPPLPHTQCALHCWAPRCNYRDRQGTSRSPLLAQVFAPGAPSPDSGSSAVKTDARSAEKQINPRNGRIYPASARTDGSQVQGEVPLPFSGQSNDIDVRNTGRFAIVNCSRPPRKTRSLLGTRHLAPRKAGDARACQHSMFKRRSVFYAPKEMWGSSSGPYSRAFATFLAAGEASALCCASDSL
jgi:hypothetical protein